MMNCEEAENYSLFLLDGLGIDAIQYVAKHYSA